MKKKDNAISYQEMLIKSLKDHDHAVAYLNAALEESLQGDDISQQVFLHALKNVMQAQGNVGSIARRAKLRRESVYKMLSENGNPHLQSFTALMHAMGFSIRVQ